MGNVSSREYQKMLGERVKLYRIAAGFSQKDLEEKSGVSVRSISRFEQGASIQLESLIKILSALKLDENLKLLVPDQTRRPSYYLEESKKLRQRVRKSNSSKQTDFKWGDEE